MHSGRSAGGWKIVWGKQSVTLLTKRMVEKPWGKDVLPKPFVAPQGKRIGEVWFEPPADLSEILVKYIFTSEKLSVQVHPSDAQAGELGETDRGKEECWLVIDAEPGAMLGVGFKQTIDVETMRTSALDGSIEDMMEWCPVTAGDFFYIPAGTVHAIGAGVSLIEIQQNSDITYRLYDYGRPRELHLDRGLSVASGERYSGGNELHWPEAGFAKLVRGPYFFANMLTGPTLTNSEGKAGEPCIVIPLSGKVRVGHDHVLPGSAALVKSLTDLVPEPGSRSVVVWQN